MSSSGEERSGEEERTEDNAEPENVGREAERRVQRDERDVERRLRLAPVPQPHALLRLVLTRAPAAATPQLCGRAARAALQRRLEAEQQRVLAAPAAHSEHERGAEAGQDGDGQQDVEHDARQVAQRERHQRPREREEALRVDAGHVQTVDREHRTQLEPHDRAHRRETPATRALLRLLPSDRRAQHQQTLDLEHDYDAQAGHCAHVVQVPARKGRNQKQGTLQSLNLFII